MGGKPRKRGVVMSIARDDNRGSYYVITPAAEFLHLRSDGSWGGIRLVSACPDMFELTFPDQALAPGECKRVRVTIEEDE